VSQENVEIVRRMYEASYGGDAEGALSYFDPNVLVDTSSARPDGVIGKGHEHLIATIGGWVDAWDEWREEIEEMRDLGDRVYVVATQRGRGKGSGIEVETRYALLYEVEGDQITGMTFYIDPAEALEAAGLRE
jgi:ketosteroid isomerase-like protein